LRAISATYGRKSGRNRGLPGLFVGAVASVGLFLCVSGESNRSEQW
jgi:hypothetical protein